MVKFQTTDASIKRFVNWFSKTGNPVPSPGQTSLMRDGVEMTNLGGGWYKINELPGYSSSTSGS